MNNRVGILTIVLIPLLACGGWFIHRRGSRSRLAIDASPAGRSIFPMDRHDPTFSEDIAPIVFANCATCHHPDGVAPFSLLTYAQVRKHAKEADELTARRAMPPWMPDDSCGPFVGQRRLTDAEIGAFRRWLADGTPEGRPRYLPPTPHFAADWELGPPDLVVKLPAPFTLPAAGKDVYQNFVLPLGLDRAKTVRAVELRSGNTRIVHHASLLLDTSGAARIRAKKMGGNSYPGMDPGEGAAAVSGRFLVWQPGTSFCIRYDNDPWTLPAGADLILQAHLRPTGKVERVQPEIGLYFTDKPAVKQLVKLMLRSTAIDIPAGSTDYAITASYVLPVAAQAIAVSVHAHYLGKDLQGYAILPDGTKKMLLRIPNWDFFWQGSYRLVTPIDLPAGTMLQMHFTYDNSEANVNNPSHPPREVRYGLNSDDEMGEFFVTMRLANQADERALTADYMARVVIPDRIDQTRTQLRLRPDDADLHASLAVAFYDAGLERQAMSEVETALKLRPACGKAHRLLANALFAQGDATHAADEYRKAVAGDAADFSAQADLGLALAAAGKVDEGIVQLRNALEMNPRDALTHTNLARVYLLSHQNNLARSELDRALQLDPEQPLALQTLRSMQAAQQ